MVKITDKGIIISFDIQDSDRFLMLRELSECENFEKLVHRTAASGKCDDNISSSIKDCFSLIHCLDIYELITFIEDSSIPFFSFEKSWHNTNDSSFIFSYTSSYRSHESTIASSIYECMSSWCYVIPDFCCEFSIEGIGTVARATEDTDICHKFI